MQGCYILAEDLRRGPGRELLQPPFEVGPATNGARDARSTRPPHSGQGTRWLRCSITVIVIVIAGGSSTWWRLGSPTGAHRLRRHVGVGGYLRPASGLSQTAYHLLFIGGWALVIVGALLVVTDRRCTCDAQYRISYLWPVFRAHGDLICA